jgi:hypothetical protein
MSTHITYHANQARIDDLRRQATAQRKLERRRRAPKSPGRPAPYRRLIEVLAAR